MDSLEVCKKTRKIAADTLEIILRQILQDETPISEVYLRDRWLEELKKHPEIFAEGWYIPPPHGIEMLFGTSQDTERLNTKTIRPEEFWPKDNISLDRKEGLITLFTGPVDRKTGIIGDFGLTIYLGDNSEIIDHLKKVNFVTSQIAQHVQTGMKLNEIHRFGQKLLAENGLASNLLSSTDPAGTNIGHTIPWSYEEMTQEENQIFSLAESNWEKVKNMISKKREFINEIEELETKPGMAITIEPRPHSLLNPKLPVVWFHTIVLFKENGEKEILAGFDNIFKFARMDYMLE